MPGNICFPGSYASFWYYRIYNSKYAAVDISDSYIGAVISDLWLHMTNNWFYESTRQDSKREGDFVQKAG